MLISSLLEITWMPKTISRKTYIWSNNYISSQFIRKKINWPKGHFKIIFCTFFFSSSRLYVCQSWVINRTTLTDKNGSSYIVHCQILPSFGVVFSCKKDAKSVCEKHCSTFRLYVAYHRLTRLKRFVSQCTSKLCN